MSETTKILLTDVLSLPDVERFEFMRLLADSFPKPSRMLSEEDSNYDAEIGRRIAEYEAGRSQPLSGKEFFQRLREKAS